MVAILLILNFLFLLPPSQVFAHPGGRDANGGHTCRTNCAQYGLQDGEYHCHTATCTLPSQTPTTSTTPPPTTTPTQTPSPIPTSAQGGDNLKIELSEIYPSPNSGEKEWGEVYNPNSQDFNLSNWKFQDGSGSKKNLSGVIGSNSWAFFEYTSGWLNNSGDTLSLLNPNGETVESYTYGETAKGVAWAKDNSGNWQQTTTPTQGAENKITAPPQSSGGTETSKSKSKTTTSKTPTSTPTSTPQVLGKKSVPVQGFSKFPADENLATPSLNLPTESTPSSPQAAALADKRPSLVAILIILAGIGVLTGAGFRLFKKFQWK